MSDRLRRLIDDGRVHVLDGAMGTVLYNRGVFVNLCYDELNLKQPDLVRGVHEEYVRAGAEILETNTFGANPVKLSSYGLEEQTEAINEAAVALALAAGGDRVAVAGAIGPLGVRIEPWGPTAREEATAYFTRQVTGLVAGGVHGFLLETFADLDELRAALSAIRAASDLPVLAHMTVGEDGQTSYGTTADTIATTLTEWEVDVIGLNCSVGPAAMLDAIERMARVTHRPLSAQPNAGAPRSVGDRKIYLASPEYMAQYARRMIDAGARFVGGCCGTTPEHIKQIRDYVASLHPRTHHVDVVQYDGDTTERPVVPLAERSRWGAKLAAGEPVASVEIMPASGWQPDDMIVQAETLRDAGVDAIAILDSPRAHSRMSALAAAALVEARVGIETIAHYTCRDRNMLGMISDLLGAAATGLRNILIVSGDPPTMGPYPDATAVFDIDSIGLTNVVDRLNRGLDPGGNAIGAPTQFVIGVAANQGATDLAREVRRFGWKIEAGADFVVTQPVFDPDHLDHFFTQTATWRVPVVAGLWPLVSLRNAEYLANEVPGVRVPDAVVARMAAAQERGRQAAIDEGLAIAAETYDRVAHAVAGVHITAPFGKTDVAVRLLDAVRSRALR